MKHKRAIHPNFQFFLDLKSVEQSQLYQDLRDYLLELYPEANELLYNTHALSSLYTVSERMGDGYCMIVMYTHHTNLAFNKGTLLTDPDGLLEGTGRLMRHIRVEHPSDYRNDAVRALITAAQALAIEDRSKPPKRTGVTISKIKV